MGSGRVGSWMVPLALVVTGVCSWRCVTLVSPAARRKNSSTGGANSMLPRERGKNAVPTWRRASTR